MNDRPLGQISAPPRSDVMAALGRLDLELLRPYCDPVWLDGQVTPMLSFGIRPGRPMWAAPASVLTCSSHVRWRLQQAPGHSAFSSSILSAHTHLLQVISQGESGQVTLCARRPGTLGTWDLSWGPIVCTSGTLLAAWGAVQIDTQRPNDHDTAAIGSIGAFVHVVSGQGVVVVHTGGDLMERQLAPQEAMMVSLGHLAAFSPGVTWGIQAVPSGMRLGAENLFIERVTGPGWALIQGIRGPAPGADREG